tara:strand:- start:283 stop:2943 length:2661 start_codon:yes stop_codon:yes gene_type:complete
MNRFIAVLFLFSLVFCQYSLSFGDLDTVNKTIEIIVENESPISGFQFQISGLELNNAFGGSSEDLDFSVSTSNLGIIIGFSWSGATIPSGTSTLTNLSFSSIIGQITNFSNVVFSSEDGNNIENINSTDFIDHGVPDCLGSWEFTSTVDECGICNGPGAVYDCGCLEISEGYCDCNNSQLDECGICGGDNSSCFYYLSIENFNIENKTLDIMITNPNPIAGFQFSIPSLQLNSVFDGIAEQSGFTVSHGENTVLGFSFIGGLIPESNNQLLTSLSYSNIIENITSIEYPILTSAQGENISNIFTQGIVNHGDSNCSGEFYGPNDTNEFGCCFDDIPDCLGICNGDAINDECGICNGDGYSCMNCFELNENICIDNPYCDWETETVNCNSLNSYSECNAVLDCSWISGGGSGGGTYGGHEDDDNQYRGYCTGGIVEVEEFCISKPCADFDEINCHLLDECLWYNPEVIQNCIELPESICEQTNNCSWINGNNSGYGDNSYCSGEYIDIYQSSCGNNIIPGCTIDIATNFNFDANVDDGSCEFPALGTLSFGEINFLEKTIEVNLNCEYPVKEFTIDISGLNITGYYGGASEYNEFIMDVDNSIITGVSSNSFIPQNSGLLFILTFDVINNQNICFNNSSILTNANIEYEAILEDCLEVNFGCNDIYSSNYNIHADYNDNSCIYSDYRVETGMYYFNSDSIEIEIGESVQWDNVGGYHSINGIINSLTNESFENPEEFYLDPTATGLIGSHTFNIPGIYNYDCDIGNHALEGMTGFIAVGQGGCMDQLACNYSIDYDYQLGECDYAEINHDCNGNCIIYIDECDVCGGEGSNGDANQNGSVNIADITFIIEFIIGVSDFTELQICISDFNNNNIVNVTDLILIIEQIL